MPIGLGLVDVPLVSAVVLPDREVGEKKDQPNTVSLGGHVMCDTSLRSISNESRLQEIQVEEVEVMDHSVVPGATLDGFNRVRSNSLAIPNLNPSIQDVNKAEAIATLEVGEKLGVTFDILVDLVVKRFQELVEKEACS
ncbi:hypothetical protein V6N12_012753 [Hibiscus sabdariffa]|uniref:Uncharacterized protein n=1 Tax=Hibiscus sabdariffa TaxID=183260 RepID=A0ABR2EFA8_9ROSI